MPRGPFEPRGRNEPGEGAKTSMLLGSRGPWAEHGRGFRRGSSFPTGCKSVGKVLAKHMAHQKSFEAMDGVNWEIKRDVPISGVQEIFAPLSEAERRRIGILAIAGKIGIFTSLPLREGMKYNWNGGLLGGPLVSLRNLIQERM